MFEELKNELNNYEELLRNKPDTFEDIYKNRCGLLDVAKAFVFDFGYDDAERLAKVILALVELKQIMQ